MKKIICLWMSLCVLLSLAAILPAAAAPAQESTMWATVSYRYDPVDENDVPESVLVSLAAAGASSQPKTYLQRAATVTWQADEANLKVNGVLQEGVSIHLEKAGRLTHKFKNEFRKRKPWTIDRSKRDEKIEKVNEKEDRSLY